MLKFCSLYDYSLDFVCGLTRYNTIYKRPIKITKEEIGKRLKEFRKENKIVRQELAELLNTTFSNIAWYEKGRNLISTSFLYTICSKYNVSADYLLGRIN